MIFRAVFWIGLVALLMPHEPDLGLGRPGVSTQTPSILSSATNMLSTMGAGCGPACVRPPDILQHLGLEPGGAVTQGLAQVKAQIDADITRREQQQRSL